MRIAHPLASSLHLRLYLRSTTALVLAFVPSLLAAQGPFSTGQNFLGSTDLSWEVSFNGTGLYGDPFSQAALVTSPPGVWQPNTTSYRWISAQSNASVGYSAFYWFRTTFNLTGFDPSTASLQFRCAKDNDQGTYRLNGGSFIAGDCGTGFQFGSTQTINTGFVAGNNILEFHVTGDGVTDGLLVSIDSFSADEVGVVPEPATVGLLATGLLALGVGARRKLRS